MNISLSYKVKGKNKKKKKEIWRSIDMSVDYESRIRFNKGWSDLEYKC